MKMMEHNPGKARKQAPGLSRKEAKEYTKGNVGKKSFGKLRDYFKK